jgi:hypothetical protein
VHAKTSLGGERLLGTLMRRFPEDLAPLADELIEQRQTLPHGWSNGARGGLGGSPPDAATARSHRRAHSRSLLACRHGPTAGPGPGLAGDLRDPNTTGGLTAGGEASQLSRWLLATCARSSRVSCETASTVRGGSVTQILNSGCQPAQHRAFQLLCRLARNSVFGSDVDPERSACAGDAQ